MTHYEIHFYGKDALNCGIRRDKVKNLLWRGKKLEFPPAIRQAVIHCGTNNIDENTLNDIENGLLYSALTIKKKEQQCFKKVNELIREKCSSISTPCSSISTPINYIKQNHDWIDEENCLRTKYYYGDCLHLAELGIKNSGIPSLTPSNTPILQYQ